MVYVTYFFALIIIKEKGAMNSEVLVLSRKDEVECDSNELKTFISEWLENDGWQFADFARFLKLVGIDTPVKLSNLKGSGRKSFTCITASNRIIDIELNFGISFLDYSEIRLTEGNERHHYGINLFSYNKDFDDPCNQPKVYPVRRIIEKDGKKLDVYYHEGFFLMCFSLSETKKWFIEIGWPFSSVLDDKKTIVENEEKIDELLWSLSNQPPVLEVFNKIQMLLKPQDGDFSKYRKIVIYYYMMDDLDSTILTDEDEAVIQEGGDSYRYFREDNIWEYKSVYKRIYLSMNNVDEDNPGSLINVDSFEEVKKEIHNI